MSNKMENIINPVILHLITDTDLKKNDRVQTSVKHAGHVSKLRSFEEIRQMAAEEWSDRNDRQESMLEKIKRLERVFTIGISNGDYKAGEIAEVIVTNG